MRGYVRCTHRDKVPGGLHNFGCTVNRNLLLWLNKSYTLYLFARGALEEPINLHETLQQLLDHTHDACWRLIKLLKSKMKVKL